MLVRSFNLSQSFNYTSYLFNKKRFKSEINSFCIWTLKRVVEACCYICYMAASCCNASGHIVQCMNNFYEQDYLNLAEGPEQDLQLFKRTYTREWLSLMIWS
jgi:hypothetical protein